jgi:hypothetical protein
MTYRDAGRQLGVPEGTLSNRLAAASADVLSPLAEGVLRHTAITKAARAVTALVVVLGLAYGGWSVLSARVEDKEVKALDGEWAVAGPNRAGSSCRTTRLRR